MSTLGHILEATINAHHKVRNLRIELTSCYDWEYLATVVIPAVGGSTAPLTRPGRSRWWRSLGRSEEGTPAQSQSLWRWRLQIRDHERWRFEELAEDGSELRAYGYDGRLTWSLIGDKVAAHIPQASARYLDQPESSWQRIASRAIRETLDPSLILPAIEIGGSGLVDITTGSAFRLQCVPRSADLVESALISPWASRCSIDIHPDTGFVLSATNTNDSGTSVLEHRVDVLDLDVSFSNDVFAVPRR